MEVAFIVYMFYVFFVVDRDALATQSSRQSGDNVYGKEILSPYL